MELINFQLKINNEDKHMRIILLTTKYSIDQGNEYLTNDLVEELVGFGNTVDVINLDWSSKSTLKILDECDSIRVLNIPAINWGSKRIPVFVKNIYKWLFASADSLSIIDKFVANSNYDLVISFSPASALYSIINHIKNKYPNAKSYMILWDFFPRYHFELNLIPSLLFNFAKFIENKAINKFDIVGLMSKANVDFFKKEFPSFRGKTEVLRLWGPIKAVPIVRIDDVRKMYAISKEKIVCVFGGQLIPGRGINLLLEVAKLMRQTSPNLLFAVAGDGPLLPLVLSAQDSYGNLKYVGKLNRNEYMDFLLAANVGLVFNSGLVTVPTYPSKSIDYFRASLPIISAVEVATDYGEILENEIQAGFSSSALNVEAVIRNIEKLTESEELMKKLGENGYRYFKKMMTAKVIATQILAD